MVNACQHTHTELHAALVAPAYAGEPAEYEIVEICRDCGEVIPEAAGDIGDFVDFFQPDFVEALK